MISGAIGGKKKWQGKPKYSEKTCPSATLSPTKSHMTDQVSKPELHSQVTNESDGLHDLGSILIEMRADA
jgi:hypothetical protein